MANIRLTSVFVCLMSMGLAPTRAFAQIYEAVGTRAQGMGGAFTAVSDDAGATWWNPAGIALTYLSVIVERSQTDTPADPLPLGPAWRGKVGSFAMAFPSLGLSYYRLRITEIAPQITAPEGPPVLEDPGAAVAGLRSLDTHQLGATFGQSLSNHLVVASTVRYIWAGQSFATGTSIDHANDLDVDFEGSGDLDVGLMAVVGPARFGATVKHLSEPEFGEGLRQFRLRRQARAGASWIVGEPGAPAKLTLAGDADLMRVTTAFGDARHVAGGAEFVLLRPQLAIRAGISANTVGRAARSTGIGGSVGLSRGFYLDGAATFGSDESRKGWSLAFRLAL
jgi:hypothetical protein